MNISQSKTNLSRVPPNIEGQTNDLSYRDWQMTRHIHIGAEEDDQDERVAGRTDAEMDVYHKGVSAGRETLPAICLLRPKQVVSARMAIRACSDPRSW
jgi:hypothetical protein